MNKKINILFCIEHLSHAGTEKQLIALINGLDKNKFNPYLCCLRNKSIESDKKIDAAYLYNLIACTKIQLDFVSFKKFSSIADIFRLMAFIKRNKIDIIQSYFQDPTVFSVIAGKLCGINCIIACFRDLGFWQKNENYLKMRITYKLCNYYLANSKAVRNVFSKTFHLNGKFFSVIYNGINTNLFNISYRGNHHNKDIKRVGIVANLNRKVKRVDLFLKAAAHVLETNKNIEFIVAGDGSLKNALIDMAMNLGIISNVTFLGTVKNIPKLLSTLDIGILSSDSEGFSNSILEYMISRLAVIATDVGGNREIIQNGINGFLVPANDYQAIGDKILELLHNKKLYEILKNNAFKTVSNEFFLEKCILAHENFYYKCIQ